MKTIDLRIDQLPEDPRLDKVIPILAPEFSRSQARKLIEDGSVYVNKKRCRMNSKNLNSGDTIRILVREKPLEELKELDPARILFENKDWIVVNKPPHLPTHETIDNSRFHLALAIQELLAKREKKKASEIYLGIHHRLDRDTSGVILFTKRKEANAAVAQAFQNREVQKTYLAICGGTLSQPKTITSFLGTHPRNKRLVSSVKRDGKFAETEVRSLDTKILQGKPISLIEAKPKTGRTHQIRVHLSENRLPILGDLAYGIKNEKAKRVMLHAWRLEILGKTFTAPLPEDFRFVDFAEP
jgi:23S rRNA pseudouridine1911/1915/1917 synthase